MKIGMSLSTPTDIPILKPRKAWPFQCRVNRLTGIESETPRVSVIIPSFNQADYLEAAIRSVLCQDYPNVECLVLDGGSKDGSAEIIEHYRSALAYARSHSDNGQSAAVNEGAQRATGDIMSFLNSDDMLAQGAISRIVKTFAQHPESMLVHGERILIDASDNVAGWSHSIPFNPDETPYNINSETAFWKSQAFDELGGFNESLSFALDLDFFCRIYAKYPIHLINQFLGYYRFHPLSKSETMDDVRLVESRECWRDIFGTDYPEAPQAPRSLITRIRHAARGIIHPRVLLAPYLNFKFLKRR
ncbi:glycosyltransferase family 2 protein [Cerasicoccus arenae]|uniref:Glycosyl transferase n=1 Tax=Cerasicoccus arenae TaxID=424488 RepID=A0A8J3GCM7_9BACT|nr:glycosyltransferase family 2 protein [Cerasicoccus arenae]MBK1857488.1 glycosyltransferase [Cerasicoccus arenae]GHB95318.1 glycosyl transferase [Cerasicoccus arenae]